MGYELHTNLYRRWLASSVQYGFPACLAAAWKCKTGRASGHLFSIISKSTSLQMESSGARSWQGWLHSASESYLIPQKWILLPAVGRRVTLSCCCSQPCSFLPKGTTSQPIPSSKEWNALLLCLKDSFSVLTATFSTNRSVKCSIFSAQLFWGIKIPKTSLTLLSSWTNFSMCICIHYQQLQVCLPYFCCFSCWSKFLKVFTSHLYFTTVPSKCTAFLKNVNETRNLPIAWPSVSGYCVLRVSARVLL